jgi:hypothetical protein
MDDTLFQGLNTIRKMFGLSFNERKKLEQYISTALSGGRAKDACRCISEARRFKNQPAICPLTLAYYVAELFLKVQREQAVTHVA